MSARRPLVAGNWKLHNPVGPATELARTLRHRLSREGNTEVAVAPVFTALTAVHEALQGSRIALAAQDVYWTDEGAFTGEVSAPLLKDAGCDFCIVGHSERRQHFGELDDHVRRKVGALLSHGLTPIICIGETLSDREAGNTLKVVLSQLDAALEGLTGESLVKVVLAYEPVWAIGTGRTASPGDAEEVHAAIRARLTERFDEGSADTVRILYGGSVKPGNAAELMAQPNIDGALVGGASLSAESFLAIVEAAST